MLSFLAAIKVHPCTVPSDMWRSLDGSKPLAFGSLRLNLGITNPKQSLKPATADQVKKRQAARIGKSKESAKRWCADSECLVYDRVLRRSYP